MMTNHSELILHLEDTGEDETFLDWQEVFGNGRPVEIEIGIGKGRFLIDAAQRLADNNYLGIEWASKYLRIAQDRALKRCLDNIRFVRTDAKEFLEFFVPANSVVAYHVYFPDPWPKKRHHKRRLFDATFIGELERTLTPQGRLWFATDHIEYFDVIMSSLQCSSCMAEVGADWPEIATNYEAKYRAQGKQIHRRVFTRQSA